MLWFVWWQSQMKFNRSDNCEPVAKGFILGSDHPLGELPELYLFLSTRMSLLRLLASYVNWFYTYKLLVLRSALTYVTSAFCRTTLLYMHYRMKNEISSLSCTHEIWHLIDCSPPILQRTEPNVIHNQHLALSSTWLVESSQWNVKFHAFWRDGRFYFLPCE